MSGLQEEVNGSFLGSTDCMPVHGTQVIYSKEWHGGTGMHMYPNTSGLPPDNVNEFKQNTQRKWI